MLVIDQPFTAFLTNYFSAHMDENFDIGILRLTPHKIDFSDMGAQTKAFLFFFFSFLLISPFFVNMVSSFSEKVKIESAP